MFDLRYHVVSLTAVFLALAIGILVGVGISGRGFVDRAERVRLTGDIAQLQTRLDETSARADALVAQQRAAEEYIRDTYPILAAGRLTGSRVGLLYVGSIDSDVDGPVRDAVATAGGRVVRVRALLMPFPTEAIEAELRAQPALAGYVGERYLGDLGRDLARELVGAGPTPLWDALGDLLLEERSGTRRGELDGVVLVRPAPPQQGGSARFLDGLYAGLSGAGVPVVGVEAGAPPKSALPVFRAHRLSTVDAVASPAGRLALALLLGGAEAGSYGAEETDRSILPPIEPLPVAPTR